MALPPKGDPRRAMYVAARSMRTLGVIGLLLSTCGGLGLARVPRAGPGGPMMIFSMILGLMFYLVPAVAYLVLAHYLVRRHFWAVVASLCLTSLALLFALFGSVMMVLMLAQQTWHPAMWIPIGAVLLIMAALGQLIYLLAKSFESIKHMPPEERGFEPIMATPISPPALERGPDGPSAQG